MLSFSAVNISGFFGHYLLFLWLLWTKEIMDRVTEDDNTALIPPYNVSHLIDVKITACKRTSMAPEIFSGHSRVPFPYHKPETHFQKKIYIQLFRSVCQSFEVSSISSPLKTLNSILPWQQHLIKSQPLHHLASSRTFHLAHQCLERFGEPARSC